MLTGGCFCGRVRYETDAEPYHQTSCHCSICRRTTGAPYVAWFSVPRSRLRLHGGAPMRFRSSVTRDDAAGRLEWVKLADGLPQFRGSRGEG